VQAFRGFAFLIHAVFTMRTYDKLIATIPDRRSVVRVRPCSGRTCSLRR
jgi:hypothetical protein